MTDIGQLFMEFGDFLIQLLVGYVITNLVFGLLEAWMAYRLSQSIDSRYVTVSRALDEEKLIALTVEVDSDQYLCYNSVTNDFVCQGRNLKEIRERFRERYPDKDAAIYNGDTTAVAVLKSQLEELKK
jgi:hypothetical protein